MRSYPMRRPSSLADIQRAFPGAPLSEIPAHACSPYYRCPEWRRLKLRDISQEGETMRNIIVVFIVLLFSGIWLSSAGASIARGGGGARPQVGNRSAGMSHANMDRGNASRNVAGGSVNRSAAGGSVNRSA